MTSCLLQVVKDGGILTELTLEAITTKVVLDVSGKMDLWCLIQPSQAEDAHLASQESNGLLACLQESDTPLGHWLGIL